MIDQLTRVVRAGWYEDPDDTTLVRWWNGLGWTDHVADKPAAHGAPKNTPEQHPGTTQGA